MTIIAIALAGVVGNILLWRHSPERTGGKGDSTSTNAKRSLPTIAPLPDISSFQVAAQAPAAMVLSDGSGSLGSRLHEMQSDGQNPSKRSSGRAFTRPRKHSRIRTAPSRDGDLRTDWSRVDAKGPGKIPAATIDETDPYQ